MRFSCMERSGSVKKSSSTRRAALKSNKIPQAVINIVESLSKIGYISTTEKSMLIYRVKAGDLTVYAEVRALLLEMADDLKKIT